ncbi:MAG: hypothetical protein ACYTHJ_18090 [Planctomycetota bacterium]
MNAVPAHDETLWRKSGNLFRLHFDDTGVVEPAPGQITNRELLECGGVGPDLSSFFEFLGEAPIPDQSRYGRVRVRELGHVPTHRKWFEIRNDGEWESAQPFVLHYLLQVGDSSNDRHVLPNDLSIINASIPTLPVIDDWRSDITGDWRALPNDLSFAWAHTPSLFVPKPRGHTVLAGEAGEAQLVGSTPAHDETLWRIVDNTFRLNFGDPGVVIPEPGEISIRDMLDDGRTSPALSNFGVKTRYPTAKPTRPSGSENPGRCCPIVPGTKSAARNPGQARSLSSFTCSCRSATAITMAACYPTIFPLYIQALV